MQTLEKVKKFEFIGRDFLTWLWFKSDTNEKIFDFADLGKGELIIEGKVTLQSEGDGETETITCYGQGSRLREARFALSENKKVTRIALKLVIGDNEWSFTLDSAWMDFKSLRTPQVEQDKKDDPDGLFYEKIFLLEQPIKAVETAFSAFIKLRTSPEWEMKEKPALLKWIKQSRQD